MQELTDLMKAAEAVAKGGMLTVQDFALVLSEQAPLHSAAAIAILAADSPGRWLTLEAAKNIYLEAALSEAGRHKAIETMERQGLLDRVLT